MVAHVSAATALHIDDDDDDDERNSFLLRVAITYLASFLPTYLGFCDCLPCRVVLLRYVLDISPLGQHLTDRSVPS